MSLASDLTRELIDARARTLQVVRDLSDAQLMGPRLSTVNPLRWEIGHLAWFQERWILRRRGAPSLLPGADEIYDSATVPHDTRWDLPLPTRAATLDYMDRVLRRAITQVHAVERVEDRDAYFLRLATFHEDMHAEAFLMTRQTLAYPAPNLGPSGIAPGGGPHPGDASVPGGTYETGATRDLPFVFDNEKWSHPVTLRPFQIAKAPVTNAQFGAFVDAGGYRTRRHWSDEGWAWRTAAEAEHPVHWYRSGSAWRGRRFDATAPLEPNHPMMHVSWHEAEAFCRWAGRRLPTEEEWEVAAAGIDPATSERANLDGRLGGCADVGAFPAGDSASGCRQMFGNAWEWTASVFGPYPGFVVDPYKEYSEPWFGTHRVLRGGSWATRSRLLRRTWRNFYTPDRRDVFAGFRTCAI